MHCLVRGGGSGDKILSKSGLLSWAAPPSVVICLNFQLIKRLSNALTSCMATTQGSRELFKIIGDDATG